MGADTPHTSQVELTVTLQCSGTRRIEQIAEYPGDGDELINAPWGEGVMCVFFTFFSSWDLVGVLKRDGGV